MAGLEKITEQILAAAKQEADAILAEAARQAEEIKAAAEQEAEEIAAGIQKKSASDVENYGKRVQSANDLYARTEALKCKQEIIATVIEKAYEKVCAMEETAYFAMLEKMIAGYALARDGEICFSEKDLAAMPADFAARIDAAAKKAGGTLSVAKEGRNIDGGFILIYGGVEENCTIGAMFDAKKEEMQDTVNGLLFA